MYISSYFIHNKNIFNVLSTALFVVENRNRKMFTNHKITNQQ